MLWNMQSNKYYNFENVVHGLTIGFFDKNKVTKMLPKEAGE